MRSELCREVVREGERSPLPFPESGSFERQREVDAQGARLSTPFLCWRFFSSIPCVTHEGRYVRWMCGRASEMRAPRRIRALDLTLDIASFRPVARAWQVIDYSVVRIAQGVTHFSPGSYDSMPTCATPIPNMFMSGDWIVNDHGSFSQGKASWVYVVSISQAMFVRSSSVPLFHCSVALLLFFSPRFSTEDTCELLCAQQPWWFQGARLRLQPARSRCGSIFSLASHVFQEPWIEPFAHTHACTVRTAKCVEITLQHRIFLTAC